MNRHLIGVLLAGQLLTWPDALSAQDEFRPTVNEKTTFFVRPVDDSGNLDFEIALNQRLREGITSRDNANVLLWEVIGPRTADVDMPNRFFEEMGMSRPESDKHRFVQLLDWYKARGGTSDAFQEEAIRQHDLAYSKAWQRSDFPLIHSWVKEMKPALDRVVEASKRPHYYAPILRPQGPPAPLRAMRLPRTSAVRSLVLELRTRAMWHLGEGRIEEAWQDLLAQYRLAALIDRGGTVSDTLAAIRAHHSAYDGFQAVLQAAEKNDDPDLTKLHQGLRSIVWRNNAVGPMNLVERAYILDATVLFAQNKIKTFRWNRDTTVLSEVVRGMAEKNLEWNAVLRNINQRIDFMVTILRVQDPVEKYRLMNTLEDQNDGYSARSRSRAQLAFLFFRGSNAPETLAGILCSRTSAYQLWVEANDEAAARDALLRTAIAAKVYKTKNGRYPDRLEQLVPEVLSEVPTDPFAGEPLRYRKLAGTGILHSIGKNMEDDAGANIAPLRDDMTIQLQ